MSTPAKFLSLLLPMLCGCTGVSNRDEAPSVFPAPSWIDAGPLIGHVSHDSARIWLRAVPGSRFDARADLDGRRLSPARIDDLGDSCFVVVFENLPPDRPLRVVLTEQTRPLSAVEVELRTNPAPSMTGSVRIAFGSCIDDFEHGGAPVLEAAAAERPDLFLFLGDNCYYVRGDADPDDPFSTTGEVGEWSSAATMMQRQLSTRRLAEMQPLIRSVPCYATWDDHDFGPNNSDSTFKGRDDALAVFRRVWANPHFGTESTPGVFCSFRHGPVELFLMDNRYHRSSSKVSDEAAVIWGDAQLKWLLDGLAASDAPVKIVANGTQLLQKGSKDDSHWFEARREYYRFIDGLHERDIDGVILLSGDRHYSELMRLRLSGRPTLFEFTSSPIQQGRALGPKKGRNPTRVWAMNGNSYGLITIDVTGPATGTITFECRDEQNRVPVVLDRSMRHVVSLKELVGER